MPNLTIEEAIKQLSLMKNKKEFLYVSDANGDNFPIVGISLYNEEEEHSSSNPLGLNIRKEVNR